MEYQGYIIKSFPKSPNLKIIVTAGRGGKIPNALAGTYTSEKVCMGLIDEYNSRVKTNGKEKTTTSKL